MKIVIIGDSTVGKSCLLIRFSDNTFTDSYFSTIGVDFKIKTIDVDGKVIKLQIWDTAGQERFQNITTSYYHNANGIAVVYDVTNRESFDSVTRWFHDVDNLASSNVCKILIGNKTDLFDARTVTEEEGRELARSLGVGFLETSAKTAENVGEMFITLARFIKDQMYGQKLASTHTNEIKLDEGRKIGDENNSWCSC